MTQSRLPNLVERFDGFSYGYRMNCECGRATSLSAADYFAEANRAHINCEHCGRSIHFGPLVAALRDEHDPALDGNIVGQLAWYHTSTWSDWPSPAYASGTEPSMREAFERFDLGWAHDLAQHTTKALHLGTYEAAIENMLRRMHDQGDGNSQFYLYRVALNIDPARINAGYRDENEERAADLTAGDLDALGLDAVRYLNVYEAMGSLSLAVRPEVIAGVQCSSVPIERLASLLPPDPFTEQKQALDSEAADWADRAQQISRIDPMDRRQMRLGLHPDPEGLIQRAEDRELHRYALWHDFEDILAQYYLPNVSPVVIRDLLDAMSNWRCTSNNQDPRTFAARFRLMATLLERSQNVIAQLTAQEWRSRSNP